MELFLDAADTLLKQFDQFDKFATKYEMKFDRLPYNGEVFYHVNMFGANKDVDVKPDLRKNKIKSGRNARIDDEDVEGWYVSSIQCQGRGDWGVRSMPFQFGVKDLGKMCPDKSGYLIPVNRRGDNPTPWWYFPETKNFASANDDDQCYHVGRAIMGNKELKSTANGSFKRTYGYGAVGTSRTETLGQLTEYFCHWLWQCQVAFDEME